MAKKYTKSFVLERKHIYYINRKAKASSSNPSMALRNIIETLERIEIEASGRSEDEMCE